MAVTTTNLAVGLGRQTVRSDVAICFRTKNFALGIPGTSKN